MKAGGIFKPVRRNPGPGDVFGAHQKAFADGSLGTLDQPIAYADGIFTTTMQTARGANHPMQAFSDGALGQTMRASPGIDFRKYRFAPKAMHGGGLGITMIESPIDFRKKQPIDFRKYALLQKHGMGQVTMDPATQAALQNCTDNCNARFSDPISLATCFANCDFTYPPSVTVPGVVVQQQPAPSSVPAPRLTIPALPSIPGLTALLPGAAPATVPSAAPAPTQASVLGGSSKMWLVAAGVATLGAVGYLVYKKRKKTTG